MNRDIAQHLRSNIVGYIALFVALSGTAYAAVGTNSVKSKHIVNGQVKEADLGTDAVTNAKVADNAIGSAEVIEDSLMGADVDEATFDQTVLQRRLGSSCPSGEAIRAVAADGSVTCGATGLGDITGVTAGFGLTGGGSAGDISLAGDPTVLQRRVSSTCPAGNAIFGINQNGTVACAGFHNAETLDNLDSSAFVLKQGAMFTDAGLPVVGGNQCNVVPEGWYDLGEDRELAYYRDPFGIVHLQGGYQRCGNNPPGAPVNLPAGYRPAIASSFAVAANGGLDATATFHIGPGGEATGYGAAYNAAALDGITFRCGPSSQNGCP